MYKIVNLITFTIHFKIDKRCSARTKKKARLSLYDKKVQEKCIIKSSNYSKNYQI